MIYVIFSKEKIRRMTVKVTDHLRHVTLALWQSDNGGVINVMTAVLRASLTHHPPWSSSVSSHSASLLSPQRSQLTSPRSWTEWPGLRTGQSQLILIKLIFPGRISIFFKMFLGRSSAGFSPSWDAPQRVQASPAQPRVTRIAGLWKINRIFVISLDDTFFPVWGGRTLTPALP